MRGHKDSTKNHPEVGKSGLTNSGNFVELLMYRVRGGDKTLENHLQNAPRNAKYSSPDIQNESIECCRDLIVEQLVVQVKESRYYSILADEATDCSMKEQLALIFRFVDKKNNIREEFVSFLECSYGLSGQSLYRTIKEFLVSVGIDISDCRGQGYDGAGAVAGKNQGLSAHVLRVNPKALYTHCSCHRFSLAVVVFCGEQRVRNLMTNIKEISYFFNLSVPRKNCLEDKILLYCPESLKHKLKDVCRTRWVERIEGMDVFEELFVPVYYSLLVMKENNDTVHYNNETSAKAESLFKLVDIFEFIVTLVVTRSILDYLLPLTRKLQVKDLDVAQSINLIQNLKLTIVNLRNSVENYH